MPISKQLADLLTYARAVLSMILALLGFVEGARALPIAAWLMIVSWTSDSLDGPLARRSQVARQTWIGDHDLEVDMLAACGLLVYMAASGFVDPLLALAYVLAWGLIFLRWGILRSLGMVSQGPIYAWFIYTALKQAPPAGFWMLGWILAILVITWPRFPRQVVPGWLAGMRQAWKVMRGERPQR
jgi:phosphatidylglycerophosphate synthase